MTATATKLRAAVAAVLADNPDLGASGFRQPGHADLAAERAALMSPDGLQAVADAVAFVGTVGIAHSTRSGPGRNSAGLATEAATAAGRPVTNGAVIVAGDPVARSGSALCRYQSERLAWLALASGPAGHPATEGRGMIDATEPVDVLRIIARPVPWPSLQAQSNRAGLRLRWDAITEAGLVLFPATEFPLQDGAHVLAEMGIPPETLVSMRHAGAAFDSFHPVPLAVPAAAGARRAEERARMASQRLRLRQETAKSGAAQWLPTGEQVAPVLTGTCEAAT